MLKKKKKAAPLETCNFKNFREGTFSFVDGFQGRPLEMEMLRDSVYLSNKKLKDYVYRNVHRIQNSVNIIAINADLQATKVNSSFIILQEKIKHKSCYNFCLQD